LEYLKSKSTLNTEHDGIFAQVNKVEVTDIHFWNFLSSLGHTKLIFCSTDFLLF